MYCTQRANCKKRNHPAPAITSVCMKRTIRHSDGHMYTVKKAGGFFWEYAD